ncbi:hypothetical protein [Streptomyces johnsoniae]|uniref:Uncharacterized protein n=1 Tax=Streptomyces johnsoniae TaxID=3075532 RepID=A0ABU2S077_9ACTN|nr:hypothetical protein [Streptomyces sp. DSM 41886]MDT0442312.1 hypothetical protein [Streptomyces sp. DSM 41886]
MSETPGGDAGPGIDLSALVGFGEPTAQPGTPVTAGAAAGAGPGPEALNLSPQPNEDMQKLISYLPALERMANVPGASRATRNMVRYIKSRVTPGA